MLALIVIATRTGWIAPASGWDRAAAQEIIEAIGLLAAAVVGGHALGNLGIVLAQQGRLGEARAQFEQALAIHREVGNRYIEGIDTNRRLGDRPQGRGRAHRARSVSSIR